MEIRKENSPRGAESRAKLKAAIELKNYEFNAHGVELGHRYRSGAVVADGTPEPEFTRDPELYYHPTTWPGARLPHAWLERGGEKVSTHDLAGKGRFTLLTGIGGEGWVEAAADVDAAHRRADRGVRDRPGRATPTTSTTTGRARAKWRSRAACSCARTRTWPGGARRWSMTRWRSSGRVMESLLGVLEPVGGGEMIERESAAPTGAGAFDASGGRRRGRRRRRRVARGAVRALAGRRGDPAREGATSSAARPRRRRSGTGCPNNRHMQAAGIEDPEEDFLHYTARLSRPQQYDPSSPTLGLTEWEYAQIRAIYESASPAAELLAERDALPYRVVRGRPRLLVRAARGQGADRARARARGRSRDDVRRRPGRHQHDERGGGARRRRRPRRRTACSGSSSRRRGGRRRGRPAPAGETVRVGARKAVIFASGGFTHDAELRANFLSVAGATAAARRSPTRATSCASARAVGAQLRNMNQAWMCPVPLEAAVKRDPALSGMFSVAGDSMLFVDKTGRRVVNEKLPYNELGADVLPVGPAARRVPVPGAGPGLGPALAGALGRATSTGG